MGHRRVAIIFPNCYRTRRGFHLGTGPSQPLTFLDLILNEAARPSALFRGWEPMRPASRRFCIGLRYTGRPRTKSKSQEVESIVSHRLKIRRGRASLPSKEGPNIHVDY